MDTLREINPEDVYRLEPNEPVAWFGYIDTSYIPDTLLDEMRSMEGALHPREVATLWRIADFNDPDTIVYPEHCDCVEMHGQIILEEHQGPDAYKRIKLKRAWRRKSHPNRLIRRGELARNGKDVVHVEGVDFWVGYNDSVVTRLLKKGESEYIAVAFYDDKPAECLQVEQSPSPEDLIESINKEGVPDALYVNIYENVLHGDVVQKVIV